MPRCDGSCPGRVGPSLAPDTPRTLGRRRPREGAHSPGARLHAVAQDSPLQTHSPASGSSREPAGPYLMELSDETSRSESSVSLGGGGGSLGGTAVKAGDFLGKNTRCHLGQAGSLRRLACSPSMALSFGMQLDARQGSGVGCLVPIHLDGEQFPSYFRGFERDQKVSSHSMEVFLGPTSTNTRAQLVQP